METIPDIIRGFRAADGEVLRIAGAEAEPFAAVDPRHLRVEAGALRRGSSCCIPHPTCRR